MQKEAFDSPIDSFRFSYNLILPFKLFIISYKETIKLLLPLLSAATAFLLHLSPCRHLEWLHLGSIKPSHLLWPYLLIITTLLSILSSSSRCLVPCSLCLFSPSFFAIVNNTVCKLYFLIIFLLIYRNAINF